MPFTARMDGRRDPVNVLFLAGGFGTRLQRDIAADADFAHLSNIPKALVPLNSRPLLDHWIDQLEGHNLFLQSNDLFYPDFVNWAELKGNDVRIQIKSNGNTYLCNSYGILQGSKAMIPAWALLEISLLPWTPLPFLTRTSSSWREILSSSKTLISASFYQCQKRILMQ